MQPSLSKNAWKRAFAGENPLLANAIKKSQSWFCQSNNKIENKIKSYSIQLKNFLLQLNLFNLNELSSQLTVEIDAKTSITILRTMHHNNDELIITLNQIGKLWTKHTELARENIETKVENTKLYKMLYREQQNAQEYKKISIDGSLLSDNDVMFKEDDAKSFASNKACVIFCNGNDLSITDERKKSLANNPKVKSPSNVLYSLYQERITQAQRIAYEQSIQLKSYLDNHKFMLEKLINELIDSEGTLELKNNNLVNLNNVFNIDIKRAKKIIKIYNNIIASCRKEQSKTDSCNIAIIGSNQATIQEIERYRNNILNREQQIKILETSHLTQVEKLNNQIKELELSISTLHKQKKNYEEEINATYEQIKKTEITKEIDKNNTHLIDGTTKSAMKDSFDPLAIDVAVKLLIYIAQNKNQPEILLNLVSYSRGGGTALVGYNLVMAMLNPDNNADHLIPPIIKQQILNQSAVNPSNLLVDLSRIHTRITLLDHVNGPNYFKSQIFKLFGNKVLSPPTYGKTFITKIMAQRLYDNSGERIINKLAMDTSDLTTSNNVYVRYAEINENHGTILDKRNPCNTFENKIYYEYLLDEVLYRPTDKFSQITVNESCESKNKNYTFKRVAIREMII